jgi:hypothetical protein
MPPKAAGPKAGGLAPAQPFVPPMQPIQIMDQQQVVQLLQGFANQSHQQQQQQGAALQQAQQQAQQQQQQQDAANQQAQAAAAQQAQAAQLQAQQQIQQAQAQMALQAQQHQAAMEAMKQQHEESMKAMAKSISDNKSTSLKLDKIENKKDYDEWTYKLDGELNRLELKQLIEDQMQGVVVVPTEKQKKRLEDLASELRQKIKGDALTICSANSATPAHEILTLLRKWGGKISETEEMARLNDFNNGKWDKTKDTLSVWISKKYRKAVALEACIPAGVREKHMRNAILSNLPEDFARIASEIRVSPPATWQEIEERLATYDAGTAEARQGEISGKTYAVKLEKCENRMKNMEDRFAKLNVSGNGGGETANVNAVQAKSKGKKGGGRGRGNGGGSGNGNRRSRSRSRRGRGNDRGGNRNSSPARDDRRGGNRGGKGKGKRPLSEVECYKCGKIGHYANDCWSRRN